MADTQAPQSPTATLKARLGEVFDEIFALGRKAGRDEGYKAARDEGYKAGLAEGARNERERMRAALEQPPPGNQAPTGQAAPDAATAGARPAPKAPAAQKPKSTGTLSKIKQVFAAEAAKATDLLSELTGDTDHQPLPVSGDSGDRRAAALSFEDRCRADWERDVGLRAEFGTLDTYIAFKRQSKGGTAGIL